MAVREYGTRSTRWRLGGAQFGPFDGGLNLRDSYVAVAPNELVSGTNLTLDENGVAFKRNDCPASASFPAPPGTVIAAFYSTAISLALIQVGSTLYKCALGGGSWTSVGALLNSNPLAFTDFVGQAVFTHGVGATGKTYAYDGTTLTSTTTVFGSVIAAWQNKIWIASNSASIWWSAAGAPLTFTPSTDVQTIREKDDKTIKALWPSSGLLVFKEDSFYRINDSTTGSYQTVDWQAGCVGPRAIVASDGRVYFWSLDGIYATTGLAPGVNVSDKVRTLFSSSTVNATSKPKISAVALNNRIYFAFPRSSSTDPDEILEFNPRRGWFMEADLGGSAISSMFTYLNSTGLATASLFLASTTKDLYTGSTRTGFAFSLQTGWVEPFGGLPSRVKSFDLTVQPAATAYGITLNYLSLGGTGVGNPTWTKSPTFATGFQTRAYNPNILGRAYQLQITDTNSCANFRIFNARLNNLLVKLQAA